MLIGDIGIKVKDKSGKIRDERQIPMNSFVSNVLSALWYDVFGTVPSILVKDDDADEDTVNLNEVDATAGTYTHGLLIGTGNTAESCDQYDLATKLTSTITYGACNVGDAQVSGSNAIMTINRTFTNTDDGGGDIVVTEQGIFCNTTTGFDFMIIRDLLDSSITLSDDEAMEVTYTLTCGSGMTLNFMKYLESIFDDESVDYKATTYTDTETSKDFSADSDARLLKAAEDATDYGIIIGDDDTAEDVEDYKLVSQLTTDMKHYEVEDVSIARDTGTGVTKIKLQRQITNNTGSSVDINEVGIVMKGDGASSRMLIARYVLDSTVELANGYSILVRPRIQVTM